MREEQDIGQKSTNRKKIFKAEDEELRVLR